MRELPILFSAPMVRAILEGHKAMTRRVVKLPHENPLGDWEPTSIGGPNGGCTAAGEMIPLEGAIWHTRTGDCLMCPYGQPGDQLWVREAWRVPASLDDLSGKRIAEKCLEAGYRKPWCPIQYEADGARNNDKDWRDFELLQSDCVPGRYRHARFMPRWASRIKLEVTGVRVERLQDISEADARAEGVKRSERAISATEAVSCFWDYQHDQPNYRNASDSFASLWDSINGPREPKHIRRRRSKGKPVDRLLPASGPNSWDANPWVWVVEFKRIEQARKAA